ncbi:hypothetical protein BHE74_00049267 [Ensete ventricosum]|nr:hypothetical protein BHE74_00049267 [Ensete ventricosum]
MLSTRRGGWPRPGPLQGWPTMAWLPARGGRPQGQQPARGGYPRAWSAVASPTASKVGGAGRRGGCPLVGRLPTAKGSRGGGAVRVKEG